MRITREMHRTVRAAPQYREGHLSINHRFFDRH
jgi:hypothetical protein